MGCGSSSTSSSQQMYEASSRPRPLSCHHDPLTEPSPRKEYPVSKKTGSHYNGYGNRGSHGNPSSRGDDGHRAHNPELSWTSSNPSSGDNQAGQRQVSVSVLSSTDPLQQATVWQAPVSSSSYNQAMARQFAISPDDPEMEDPLAMSFTPRNGRERSLSVQYDSVRRSSIKSYFDRLDKCLFTEGEVDEWDLSVSDF